MASGEGIAPKHCQVYPAQGSYWLQDLGEGTTIHGMKRIVSETVQLQPYDVVMTGSHDSCAVTSAHLAIHVQDVCR